ncbi:hypothetical protein AB1Y20_011065 [Prymnesium parvum]|uniref:Fe2OG dioxygenase domain-containing protein n=1 Tax=Prymnesium parvum TaxID=97485 RepID=A0AB34ILK1_PRYPA
MPKRQRSFKLTLDESAFLACDAAGFQAQQWPHPLKGVLRLKDDCTRLSAAHPEENFFLPWREAAALLAARRRPALLGYVAELLDFYLDQLASGGMRLARRRCGAEFWVQRRAAREDIPFHWDKDEALREAAHVLVHPAVSTVTYLTHGGAPTVVLAARASASPGISGGQIGSSGAELQLGARRRRMPPDGVPRHAAALVSYPRAGKLLAFSGALLHGVPSALAEACTGERLTLLVNVWVHHHPLGVSSLPPEFTPQLTAVTAGRLLSSDPSSDPIIFPPPVAAEDDAAESPAEGPRADCHGMGPLKWRALGRALSAQGVAGVPTGREALRELRLDVCGEEHVMRVLLHQSRRLVGAKVSGGAVGGGHGQRQGQRLSREMEAGSLRCFGVPYITEPV